MTVFTKDVLLISILNQGSIENYYCHIFNFNCQIESYINYNFGYYLMSRRQIPSSSEEEGPIFFTHLMLPDIQYYLNHFDIYAWYPNVGDRSLD